MYLKRHIVWCFLCIDFFKWFIEGVSCALQWFHCSNELFLPSSSGCYQALVRAVLKPPAVNTAAFSSYPQPCQAFCSRAVSVAIEGRLCGDGCPGEGSGARHGLCALFQFISMWIHCCRRVSLKQRAPCSSGPHAGGASDRHYCAKSLHDALTAAFRVRLSCAFKFGLFSDHAVLRGTFLLIRGCSFISWETFQTSFNFKYQQIDLILIIF